MRAGQDRDHVTGLCRLLLAAASLAYRASLFMRSIIVHRVRVVRLQGLLGRLIQKLLMPGYFALASSFAGLMVAIIVAAATDLVETLAGHPPGCRPATQLLIVELQRHAIVVQQAALVKQLLLDAGC